MSEDAHHKQLDRADLNKISKNETNLTIKKYITKLKGIFNVLEKYMFTLL